MLFEMLSGRPPFVGEQDAQIIGRQLFAPPPSLLQLAPSTDPPLVALVERTLAKDPKRRPTMLAVAGELISLRNGELGDLTASKIGIVAAQTVHLQQPRHTTLGQGTGQLALRRSLWAWSVAAALAGVVGAGALWHLLGRPERAHPAPAAISWSITSEPAGAEVIGMPEGVALGRTPLLHERSAAPGVQVVVLQKPGYSEQRLDLRRDQAMKVHAVLLREAAAADVTAPTKKSATAAGAAARAGRGAGAGAKAPAPSAAKPARPAKRSGPLHNSEVKLFND